MRKPFNPHRIRFEIRRRGVYPHCRGEFTNDTMRSWFNAWIDTQPMRPIIGRKGYDAPQTKRPRQKAKESGQPKKLSISAFAAGDKIFWVCFFVS
jgi:hypothetical protein